MFSELEQLSSCIVATQNNLQFSTLSNIPISPDKMQRIDIMWRNKKVSCISFISPKNTYENTYASTIFNKKIIGNAILLNLTADEISNNHKPTVWSSMASKLPKVIPLDDKAKQRILDEQNNRREAWNEYYARKYADHDDEDEYEEEEEYDDI